MREPQEDFDASTASATSCASATSATSTASGLSGASAGVADIPEHALRRLYADYRVRQARSLLSLMPREAVRPLYRRATRAPTSAARGGADPMDVILSFAETLLPLPPYEVWLGDFRANPAAHWADLEGSADVPSPATPATVDTRRVRIRAQGWNAHLRGFRDDDIWRGFIAFEDVGVVPPQVHRTAVIFREDSLDELRARFRDFESASLEAFLRSSIS